MSTNSEHEHRTHPLRADSVLPMTAEEAQERLQARLIAGRSGAFDEAVPVRLVVGPSRVGRLPAKRVVGAVLPPHENGRTVVFPLHWEAVGLTATAYPAMDANIAITAIDDTTCLLSFVGRYAPPLGAFGALADRAAMSRVAEATAEAVVNRLAEAIRETPSRPVGV